MQPPLLAALQDRWLGYGWHYRHPQGWTHSPNAQGWLWWRFIEPTGSDEDLESLTENCRAALEQGWRTLSGPIDEIFVAETADAAETFGDPETAQATETA